MLLGKAVNEDDDVTLNAAGQVLDATGELGLRLWLCLVLIPSRPSISMNNRCDCY